MHLAKQNALWYPSGFPFFQTCQTHGYWMEKKPGLLDGINTYAQRNHMIFRLMQALPVPSTIQKYVGKRSWGIYLTKSLCQNIPRHTRNDALTIWYFAILHYFSYDSHIWHNYTTQEQPSNHKKNDSSTKPIQLKQNTPLSSTAAKNLSISAIHTKDGQALHKIKVCCHAPISRQPPARENDASIPPIKNPRAFSQANRDTPEMAYTQWFFQWCITPNQQHGKDLWNL